MNAHYGRLAMVAIYATVNSRLATGPRKEIAANAVSLPRIKSRSFPSEGEFELLATWFPRAAQTLADAHPQEGE